MPILKVDVREEHIEAGFPQSPEECPVALALEDCPGVSNVWVYSLLIRGALRGRGFQISTPQEVKQFLTRFDRGCKPLEPFSFRLEVG